MQSNATINIFIAKRCFYIASLNNFFLFMDGNLKTCFGRYSG